jgi:ATP-binding cassette subfamily B protein
LVAEDSEIILLDEATSSVDKKTESLIYDNIFDYYKDKIIVASTHNLNILNKFDYVYVLKN